jgi:DNA invertase Pin-like site-specific DNA recombinase
MDVIGYARVSTTDQNLGLQETALRAAGCTMIRSEKRSGGTTAGRDELRIALDILREGDVLMLRGLIGWRAASETCKTSCAL